MKKLVAAIMAVAVAGCCSQNVESAKPLALPVVFVGDHNCGPATEPAAEARKVLKDARDISEKKDPGPINTFHNWGKIQGIDWRRCDYIYVSDGIRVCDFVTHDDKRPGTDRYPTDHYLLSASIEL